MATYQITADGKTTTVEADSTDHNPSDGNLRAWKNGAIVAEFRYWSSVVRKAD